MTGSRTASFVARLPALLLLLLVAGPTAGQDRAASDAEPGSPATWLVTRDGQRIELSEPWRREGERVLFRTAAGTLSVIRTEEIDFEASRVPAPEPPAPAPDREEVEPVLILENEEGARADAAPAAAPDTGSSSRQSVPAAPVETPSAERPAGGQAAAEVTAWTDVSETGDKVILYGTLRNNRGLPLERVRLRVDLLDETGEVLMSTPARLARRRVPARGTVNFQAYFDSFVPYSDVDFVIEGTS